MRQIVARQFAAYAGILFESSAKFCFCPFFGADRALKEVPLGDSILLRRLNDGFKPPATSLRQYAAP